MSEKPAIEANDAVAQLRIAENAYRDASRPHLPRPIMYSAGFLVFLGTALLTQWPSNIYGHFAMMLLALCCFAGAYLLPARARRAMGLSGYRGPTANEHLMYACVLVPMFTVCIMPNTIMAVVFPILGIPMGVLYTMVLRSRTR